MDDLEKLERVLNRVRLRHSARAGQIPEGRNLREAETARDVLEAIDYLERHRADCDPPDLRCPSCGLMW